MNLVEKIKRREINFETKEIFDISDTIEIVNKNYETIVSEIQLLREELKKLSSINYDKSTELEKTISIYENLKDELIDIFKVFKDSKLTYEEKNNIIFRLGKDYEIRKKLKNKQGKFINKIIYHYTSFQNFINIIQTKQLWFSELGTSNDPNEGKVLLEYLNEDNKNYFKNLIKNYQNEQYKSFICSFSGNEESQSLNLWRAYGDNCNGIALGFKIVDNLIFDNKFYLYGNELVEVIYPENIQNNKSFEWVISALNKYEDIITTDYDKKYLCTIFQNYSCFFKKYWFKDEREIRLIQIIENKVVKDRYAIPIIEQYQKETNNLVFEPGGAFYPLCFNEVIIGPKNKCSIDTIKSILKANEYSDNIKIRKSEIEFS